MFDDAHYRWKHEPDDGEYELQFDRYEADKSVLLIVDRENDEIVGQVVLPTIDVPHLEPDETVGGAIFDGTIRDGEIDELTYNPELTEQRMKEAQELHYSVRNSIENESDTER